MKNHTPKIILLEIVKSFENYLRLLGEAEKMVTIFSTHQLQVAVQKFRFNHFNAVKSSGSEIQVLPSPLRIPEETGISASNVMMMTHETDAETGEYFSFLGGKYFMEKIEPALVNNDYVEGLYLN